MDTFFPHCLRSWSSLICHFAFILPCCILFMAKDGVEARTVPRQPVPLPLCLSRLLCGYELWINLTNNIIAPDAVAHTRRNKIKMVHCQVGHGEARLVIHLLSLPSLVDGSAWCQCRIKPPNVSLTDVSRSLHTCFSPAIPANNNLARFHESTSSKALDFCGSQIIQVERQIINSLWFISVFIVPEL